MECGCIYNDFDAYDLPVFFNSKIVCARTKHICTECEKEIQPKDNYERVNGKWNDIVQTYKICNDCLAIRDEFFCEGYAYGEILNDLAEHINYVDGKISSECLMRLPESARYKVLDMIQEYWNYCEND